MDNGSPGWQGSQCSESLPIAIGTEPAAWRPHVPSHRYGGAQGVDLYTHRGPRSVPSGTRILSLGVRWQKKAGLVKGSAGPSKCYVLGVKVCRVMGQSVTVWSLKFVVQLHKKNGSLLRSAALMLSSHDCGPAWFWALVSAFPRKVPQHGGRVGTGHKLQPFTSTRKSFTHLLCGFS